MILLGVFLAFAIFLALFAFLFRSLVARPGPATDNAEWLDSFSLETYAPLQRLLDTSDIAFLESQPGYRPEIGKQLLRERRKIFRGYLRLLIQDFNQLMHLGKLMVVYGAHDRPELAQALWRQQLGFYAAVTAIQCKLALNPVGWPAVDVHKLVQALDTMRHQVQLLARQRVAAAQLA